MSSLGRISVVFLFALGALVTARVSAQDGDVPAAPDVAPARATESGAGLGVPAVPAGFEVPASSTDDLGGRVERLDTLLRTQSDEGRDQRITGGAINLGVGIAAVGGSIALFAVDDARDPLFATLAGLVGALGLGTSALGIVSLSITTTAERRYVRFATERDTGRLSARAIGRYEGALWAEAELSLDTRLLSIGSAVLILGLAGVEMATTALFATDDTTRILGYSASALIGALGAYQIAVALEESTAERRFREYEDATSPTIAFAPLVGPGLLGLRAAGTF